MIAASRQMKFAPKFRDKAHTLRPFYKPKVKNKSRLSRPNALWLC